MKKNLLKKSIINIIFGLLVIVALVLIFNRPIKNKVIGSYQPKVTRQEIAATNRRTQKKVNGINKMSVIILKK